MGKGMKMSYTKKETEVIHKYMKRFTMSFSNQGKEN